MAISQEIRELIFNAHADRHVCLLATSGENGPNISPKGSVIVYDDEHLAYWERSKRQALKNLSHDPRVVVIYQNMGKFLDGELEYPGGILRFFGTVTLHDSGDIREDIRSRLQEREKTHEGAEEGIGVLIKLERAEDLRGNSVM